MGATNTNTAPAVADTGWGARVVDRSCSVEACERKAVAVGMCAKHRWRLLNTGSVDLAPPKPPRVCKFDGCAGSASARGTAHGWCPRHYTAWKRHGDPALAGRAPAKKGLAPCAIEDCEATVFTRDWCTRHYTRWQRYGDPLVRQPGEVRDGKRICPRCKQDKPLAEMGRTYCRSCGCLFQAEFRASCPDAVWRHAATRRARLNEVEHEAFDRQEIFERDGWVCQICSEPVDRELPYRKPNSPSLDHIVPVARGGAHTRANAQTACLRCNMRKGARVA